MTNIPRQSPTHLEAPLELKVASVSWKGHTKRIRLEPPNVTISLPRSACLTKGDRVLYAKNRLSVPCDNGSCQILPTYISPVVLSLGELHVEVVVKEITDAEEHTAYEHLSNLHYRGQTVHGRTARLIVRTYDPAYPSVLGFIELATPFFMNKPRSRLLNSPFQHGPFGWDVWDIHTLRKHIHRIVRISRAVVSPEFRGFNIGSLLVTHAAHFARQRWQVTGQKPCFMEISADMLKFVPFVRRAGMRYIGETEGNLGRVAKDMSYLISRFGNEGADTSDFESISGILDQQISRMNKSLRLMQEHNFDVKELSKRLQRLTARSVLKDFDLFRGIVSLPKPTYFMGLTEPAERFLSDRLSELGLAAPEYTSNIDTTPISGAIRLTELTITYKSQVRRNQATHAIQQAFDISPTDVRTNALYNLSCTILPGTIVLIEGPSGSGKTTLLESILGHATPDGISLQGDIKRPNNFHCHSFQPIRSRKSLIELFDNSRIGDALYYLGLAGLSEPLLYLKRFQELSSGQQYRAMIARMLVSGCNVWVADEFCSTLDELTANLVSHNLQRIARRHGVTVIVAAANPNPFIHSLQPDSVLRLSNTAHSSVLTGVEYIRRLGLRSRPASRLQYLSDDDHSLLYASEGPKKVIIYKGQKEIYEGTALLSNGSSHELWRVIRADQTKYGNLHRDIGTLVSGVSDPRLVKTHLADVARDLEDDKVITIVEAHQVDGELRDGV